MAAFLLLAALLLLGTGAGQAQAEIEGCLWLQNATEGNFSVETAPETYQANTTYLVTIKDGRNHSSSAGQFLLQALSPQNASVGQWQEAPTGNCSSLDTAVLNGSESTARWTSPGSSLPSVQIRVYLSFPELNTTELKTFTLKKGAETTTLPPRPPPNSQCRAGSSSLLLAALLLLTASLLS